MKYQSRSIYCGQIRKEHSNTDQCINGWVHRIRNHGGLIFLIIRDRTGLVQVLINEHSPQDLQAIAAELHVEYCVSVTGTVLPRSSETVNPELPTGEVEIHPKELLILSKSAVPVFPIEEDSSKADENTRLKYRYLDLRSGKMQKHITLRHNIMQSARSFLIDEGFLEIETPTLINSTPEGARDFLVPSRQQLGMFFALAQSPQLYKQLLMISGFDKYFQFAHCFRDEDLRGDRQAEHTQLDIELSFAKKEHVLQLIEKLFGHVFSSVLDMKLPVHFQRMSHHDAMNRYGTDKPDLRYELEIADISSLAKNIDFAVFENALKQKDGHVKCLRVPNAARRFSRKNIEDLERTAKSFGARGLAWTKYQKNDQNTEGFQGGIARFLMDHQAALCKELSLHEDDLLLFAADSWNTACSSLGAIRTTIAKTLDLIPQRKENTADNTADNTAENYSFLWVEDFPLFEWDEDSKRWQASHHMFSMPKEEDLPLLQENPAKVRGELYDLVCNGMEIASGSVRIHNYSIQKQVFSLLGMSEEEIERKFSFFLEALRYGAPPHAGIAPGIDRLLMIIAGTDSIREMIAFPKNTQGISPLDNSPNQVEQEQLDDLGLTHKTSPYTKNEM